MKRSPGFTLIELVTTVAVLAVLATVALPNYRAFVQTQKLRQASYDLMTSLVFARSEAIKRNATVTVTQATGGWTNGWSVTVGAVSLRTQDAYSGTLSISNSASLTSISYSNDGRALAASSIFKIASTDASSTLEPRCVTIQLGGMPSSKLGGC